MDGKIQGIVDIARVRMDEGTQNRFIAIHYEILGIEQRMKSRKAN